LLLLDFGWSYVLWDTVIGAAGALRQVESGFSTALAEKAVVAADRPVQGCGNGVECCALDGENSAVHRC